MMPAVADGPTRYVRAGDELSLAWQGFTLAYTGPDFKPRESVSKTPGQRACATTKTRRVIASIVSFISAS